jgi:hypothetical protein
MPGRGDNNKNGSAGRGGSNQSNQPFAGQDVQKSNHNKHKSGGVRSRHERKSLDQGSNRNKSLESEKP